MTLFLYMYCTQEEREVLCSIYESDECFKEQSASSFSYRVHVMIYEIKFHQGEYFLSSHHVCIMNWAEISISCGEYMLLLLKNQNMHHITASNCAASQGSSSATVALPEILAVFT